MGKKRNVEERIDQGDIIEVEMAESVDRLNVEGEEGESKKVSNTGDWENRVNTDSYWKFVNTSL